jgi:HupE / UreJ protein
MDLYEGNRKLNFPDVGSVRLVTDDDPSFSDTYQMAADHMAGEKISPDTKLFPLQGFLDVMFDYKIISPESSFSINPRFDRLGLHVTTVLKFTRANGAVRAFEYVGLPGLVRLDPSWSDAVWRFTQMGFFHLLDSSEALLFLLCLAMPLRRARSLVPAAAAFAVAYSLTFMAAAAYHMAPDDLWFQPLIATIIPLSIFYVAIENILGARIERRWLVALVFGLAYGFSFAAALQTMLQFAGSHPTVSILAFSAGIDVGLVAVLLLMVPGLVLLFRYVAEERIGTIVLSAIVAHTAWHALVDRYAAVRKYPIRWPDFNLLLLASVLRWMMVGVVLAAAVWAIGLVRNRPAENTRAEDAALRR